MPATLDRVIRRCLNTLTVPATDTDLLQAFHLHRDPEAFTELVVRHGPVVLGVARRVLGRSADVDDVFQATFLSLARNVCAVRDPGRLAGWLHRVALRTARRALARRRPTLPMEMAAGVGMSPEDRDLSWREGLQVLDAELNALPGRLRSPLVLCYLDGLTRDEAARRLGYSLAKLKRRLEEGRGRLRDRLTRRGVSAALLVAATGTELRAVVPPTLLTQTAALPFGPVSEAIVHLSQSLTPRVLPGLLWKSVLVIGLLGGGLAAGFRGQAPAQSPVKDPPAPAKAEVVPSLEAPLPAGAVARLGTTRFRHNNGSNSSVLSKDGKLLVTTGKTTIVVWDTATGERKQVIRNCGIQDGFTTGSQRVALSPDGSLVANFSEYEVSVRVWDVATGKQLYTIGHNLPEAAGGANRPRPRPRPDSPAERIMTFDEAGKELLLLGGNGARRFEAKTGKELGQYEWKATPLAVSTNGRWCLTNANVGGAGPRRLAVVDLSNGKAGPAFDEPKPADGNVALSADGKRIAAVAADASVVVTDVGADKTLATFEDLTPVGRDRGFTMPTFSADGKTLFVGTQAGLIRRFDLVAGKKLAPLKKHLWWATGVHPMPDGKTLISAGWDSMVRKFDLTTGDEIAPPPGYARYLSLAASADGSRLALGDWVGRLDVYDQAGKVVRTLDTTGAAIGKLAMSPDGKTLAAVERDGTLRTWDLGTGREGGGVPTTTPGKEAWASVFRYSPDGRRLLVGLRESSLICLDAATRKELWAVGAKSVSGAGFSPDGRLLVTGGWDNQLTWRDPATGQPGRVVATPDVVDCVSFAPDGRTFVSSHHDGTIRLWDAENGKPLGVWTGHQGAVWWARFSPDGKWVASGSVDETVRVWEVASGKELAKYVGHDSWVWEGCWLGGRRLATAVAAEVLIWDLKPAAGGKLDTSWDDLAGDPVKAYQAQWALIADPKAAAELIRSKQGPDKAPAEEKQIQTWIADLDRDEFRTRERAMKDLRGLGRFALPYLRTARPKAKAEAEQRIGTLIAELDQGPTPDERRQSRAVQALELAGTPDATAVLKEWAGGLPGTPLTEDAAAAVRRRGGK